MAKTTSLTVAVGRTVGLPNYGSIRFDLGETVALEPGDDPDTVYRDTYARVATRVAGLVQGVTGGKS